MFRHSHVDPNVTAVTFTVNTVGPNGMYAGVDVMTAYAMYSLNDGTWEVTINWFTLLK